MNNHNQQYEIPDDESDHYSEEEIVEEATDSDEGGEPANEEPLQATGND